MDVIDNLMIVGRAIDDEEYDTPEKRLANLEKVMQSVLNVMSADHVEQVKAEFNLLRGRDRPRKAKLNEGFC